MEKNKLNVLLYSSGLDSYLSYYKLKDDLDFVYFFETGIKYNKYEKNKFINFFNNKNNLITKIFNYKQLSNLEDKETYFLPFRNFIYVFLVLSYIWKNNNRDNSKKVDVYIGGMKDDRVNDNNKEIFDKFNNFINSMYNTDLINVKSVFNWEISKTEALIEYVSKGRSIEKLFINTFSCYQPNNIISNYKLTFKNRKKFNFSKFNNFLFNMNDNIYYKSYECMSCKACLRKNIAIFNSLNIALPFKNISLFNEYINDDTLPNWRKEEMMNYYNYIKDIK